MCWDAPHPAAGGCTATEDWAFPGAEMGTLQNTPKHVLAARARSWVHWLPAKPRGKGKIFKGNTNTAATGELWGNATHRPAFLLIVP